MDTKHTTEAAPRDALSRFAAPGQKVKPFARFEGTSAWRKHRRRAKEYARYQAALKAAEHAASAQP